MTFSDPAFAALVWDRKTHKGEKVNLTGYHETWRDSFNSMSTITSNDLQLTGVNWYAPGRRDLIGVAKFVRTDTIPTPFHVVNGTLNITAQKLADGTYQSGHIQGVNNVQTGSGHTQTMGYWEAGIRFAKGGVGTWPSFWLISADRSAPRTEIDIVEGYGGDPTGHHAAIHLAGTYHPGGFTRLNKINPATGKPWWTTSNMFDGLYHTYAVMLDDEAVKIYYDGLECCRFPMTKYFRTPFYMLLSHALYQADIAKFVSPASMGINYVRTCVKL